MSSSRRYWILGIEYCIPIKSKVAWLLHLWWRITTFWSLSLKHNRLMLFSLVWTGVVRDFLRCLHKRILDQPTTRAERTRSWNIKRWLLAKFLIFVAAASRLQLFQLDSRNLVLLLHIGDGIWMLRNLNVWKRLRFGVCLLLFLLSLPLMVKRVWGVKALRWNLTNAAAANLGDFLALRRVDLLTLSWSLAKVKSDAFASNIALIRLLEVLGLRKCT